MQRTQMGIPNPFPHTEEDARILYRFCIRSKTIEADRADASIMSRTTAIHTAMRNPGEVADCDAGLPEFNHNTVR